MDTSIADITFDEDNFCNYCKAYQVRAEKELLHHSLDSEYIRNFIDNVKKHSKDSEYDCVIGVSGGVDSTYVAYIVKELGLKPLALHLDNGWNSELAVANIEKTLDYLEIDLFTFVIDWEEFKDLQLSFIQSSISNLEIPTDHAIFALLYREAAKREIKYIVSGSNIVTEAIMPTVWMEDAKDLKLLNSIHKRFGSIKLKTFPTMSILAFIYYTFFLKIKQIPILNYIEYNKEKAKNLLIEKLGWKDYGGKHFESIFTRFFQGYILIQKHNMDKRIPHLSTLIMSGQISRKQALEELKNPPYSEKLLKEDLDYFIKKFGLTAEGFSEILNRRGKSDLDYPSNKWLFNKSRGLMKMAKNFAKSI